MELSKAGVQMVERIRNERIAPRGKCSISYIMAQLGDRVFSHSRVWGVMKAPYRNYAGVRKGPMSQSPKPWCGDAKK